jgi:hypothetical protein
MQSIHDYKFSVIFIQLCFLWEQSVKTCSWFIQRMNSGRNKRPEILPSQVHGMRKILVLALVTEQHV